MRVKNKSKNKELQEDIATEEKIKKAMDKDIKDKQEPSDFVKLYNDHHAFINSLEYTLEKEPSKINEFIINNWKRVFPTRPFPSRGGTLQMLKVCIQYGYIMQAYKKHGMKTPRRFIENYHKAIDLDRVNEPIKLSILDRCEKYSQLSKIIIEPLIQGENEMVAKRVKTKTKRKPAAKIVKKIVNPKRVVKKTSEKRETKVTKCLDLLLKRRYDDADICKIAQLLPKHVTWYRLKLNRGEFKNIGYIIPKPAVQKIGGIIVKKEKIVKKKVVKKK